MSTIFTPGLFIQKYIACKSAHTNQQQKTIIEGQIGWCTRVRRGTNISINKRDTSRFERNLPYIISHLIPKAAKRKGFIIARDSGDRAVTIVLVGGTNKRR